VIIAKAISQIMTNGADIGESPISTNALYRQPKMVQPQAKGTDGKSGGPTEMASTSPPGAKSWER
jgi:hypothetical protein